MGAALVVLVGIGLGGTAVTLREGAPEILRRDAPAGDPRDRHRPALPTTVKPAPEVVRSDPPVPTTAAPPAVEPSLKTPPAEPVVAAPSPPGPQPDESLSPASPSSSTSTTSTTTTMPPPAPPRTRDGLVNGCNTFGENCDGNPIYRELPPAVGFDWRTWETFAAVDSGTTLTARCWAHGAPHTNYRVDPLDLGPDPYDSDIQFNVQVPGSNAWGWIPDVWFVRDEVHKLGLPECPGGSDA